MRRNHQFYSIYHHGFARLAVAIPAVRIAEPAFNGERTSALALPMKGRLSFSFLNLVSQLTAMMTSFSKRPYSTRSSRH